MNELDVTGVKHGIAHDCARSQYHGRAITTAGIVILAEHFVLAQYVQFVGHTCETVSIKLTVPQSLPISLTLWSIRRRALYR